uniref:Uncharacterized protein n=1 Tax=Anguilla anguilla TaxID=7936 RepID=A0A0E9RNS7_ANGAN
MHLQACLTSITCYVMFFEELTISVT